MTATAQEILRVVCKLADKFGVELSETQQCDYVEELAVLTVGELEAAALHWRRFGKPFMPKGCDLIAAAGHRAQDSTEQAWQAFRKAIGKFGAWWSVLFEDGAIARAIEAMWGSWPNACLAEYSPEMWASKRKEWDRVYPMQPHEPRYLAGLITLGNRSARGAMTRGLEPPERIGLVLATGGVEARTLPPGSNPLALLGGESVKALPSGEEEPAPAEAAAIVARLKAQAAAHVEATPGRIIATATELSEAEYTARLQLLRRQAAEITGEAAHD